MTVDEGIALVGASLTGVVAIFTALLSGWFVVRIHKLETRVETLETRNRRTWNRNMQLRDFIYKLGHVPPDPVEDTDDDE